MSAERLRDAAKVLRESAEKASPGRWKLWGMDVMADEVGDSNVETAHLVATTYDDRYPKPRTFNAQYIATVDPPVALMLADWLDDIVSIWERAEFMADGDGDPITFGEAIDSHALVVANAILGDC